MLRSFHFDFYCEVLWRVASGLFPWTDGWLRRKMIPGRLWEIKIGLLHLPTGNKGSTFDRISDTAACNIVTLWCWVVYKPS